MTWLWILLGVVLLIVLWLVTVYNGLVGLRNRVDNAWAQVEVQLKRRYDLIPNLVETVKGYAAHEQQTFERVIAARNAAQAAQGPAEQAQAENLLTGALCASSSPWPRPIRSCVLRRTSPVSRPSSPRPRTRSR